MASEFEEFVSSMPKSAQPDLMSNDAASTAFYQARKAGWDATTLIDNAVFQYRRRGAVGLVIFGLRKLAEHPPPAAAPLRRREDPDRWKPEAREALDPGKVPERVQVLRAALEGKVSEPEAEMESVIRRQRWL